MDNHYTIPIQTNCKDINSYYTQEFCFEISLCDPTPRDGIVTECSDVWNCSLCKTDRKYHIPYVSGDKIQIQTQLFDYYNDDRENPVTGWGSDFVQAILQDMDGNSLTSDVDDIASRKIVGWDGEKSYQIIEIDTSKTIFNTNDCWSLKIRTFDSDSLQVQELCTHHFAKRPCDATCKIKGDWQSEDFFGNYYGEPIAYVGDNFTYDNTLRYYGYVREEGAQVVKDVVRNTRINIEHTTNFLLVLERLVPPFVKNILSKQHMGAPRFWVDDVEYENDNLRIENDIERSNMFKIEVGMEQVESLNDAC